MDLAPTLHTCPVFVHIGLQNKLEGGSTQESKVMTQQQILICTDGGTNNSVAYLRSQA